MNRTRTFLALAAFTFLVAAALLFGGRSPISDNELTKTASAQQTDLYLQRRIDQIEQRFYMMESRLNSIEQSSRYAGTTLGASPRIDAEISTMRTQMEALRTQLDTLRQRVGEIECGLAKVDERTLTAQAREQRRRAGTDSTEPCRANPNVPVKLSAR